MPANYWRHLDQFRTSACAGPTPDRAAEWERNRSAQAHRGRIVQSGNCIQVIYIDNHRKKAHQQHLRQA